MSDYRYDHGRYRPAVNVKIHVWPTAELVRQVATDNGDDPENFLRWYTEQSEEAESAPYGTHRFHAYEEWARDDGFQDARDLAVETFGCNPNDIFPEGRSGGWLVADICSPDWTPSGSLYYDAEDPDQDNTFPPGWADYATAVRTIADDVSYTAVELAYLNGFLPENEATEQATADAVL